MNTLQGYSSDSDSDLPASESSAMQSAKRARRSTSETSDDEHSEAFQDAFGLQAAAAERAAVAAAASNNHQSHPTIDNNGTSRPSNAPVASSSSSTTTLVKTAPEVLADVSSSVTHLPLLLSTDLFPCRSSYRILRRSKHSSQGLAIQR